MAGQEAGRVRSDAARNRERILVVAADQLARDPGATFEDVVRASGLARATVYRNFANRATLVDAVVDRALAVVADLLVGSRPDEGSATAALTRLTRAACAAGPEVFVVLRLLDAGATSVTDVTTRRQAGQIEQLLLDLVGRGRTAGEFRADVPAVWLADQWFGLLQSADAHPLADKRDAADLVVALFLRGAGAVPG